MQVAIWIINFTISIVLFAVRWAAGLGLGYVLWNQHMMLFAHFVDGGPFPWYLNLLPPYFTTEPGVLWLVPVFLIANVILPLMVIFPKLWPIVLAGLGYTAYNVLK